MLDANHGSLLRPINLQEVVSQSKKRVMMPLTTTLSREEQDFPMGGWLVTDLAFPPPLRRFISRSEPGSVRAIDRYQMARHIWLCS